MLVMTNCGEQNSSVSESVLSDGDALHAGVGCADKFSTTLINLDAVVTWRSCSVVSDAG